MWFHISGKQNRVQLINTICERCFQTKATKLTKTRWETEICLNEIDLMCNDSNQVDTCEYRLTDMLLNVAI